MRKLAAVLMASLLAQPCAAAIYITDSTDAADVWVIEGPGAAADCWVYTGDISPDPAMSNLWVYVTDAADAADKWVVFTDDPKAADPIECLQAGQEYCRLKQCFFHFNFFQYGTLLT